MEQVKRTPEAARSEEVCVVLQRIHEARMEQMQGGPGRYDEQVLPDSKAGASARQREAREAEERSRREEREKERRDRQRTRQQHGLRHIWNTLLRPGASDTSAGTPDVPGVPLAPPPAMTATLPTMWWVAAASSKTRLQLLLIPGKLGCSKTDGDYGKTQTCVPTDAVNTVCCVLREPAWPATGRQADLKRGGLYLLENSQARPQFKLGTCNQDARPWSQSYAACQQRHV